MPILSERRHERFPYEVLAFVCGVFLLAAVGLVVTVEWIVGVLS